MNNKDMPAMPMANENGAALNHSDAGLREGVTSGLVKREMIAMRALHGLTFYGEYSSMEYTAEDAAKYDDALLKGFEK
ncbi:hypothetical protein NVP1110O_30 [Vibrio phage 1.110.O._10N.261.52.C1]|nr:hypothetical protein NVP1110O_30 [Vibrio phage 1.110.O._10N.261.52.C1]